MAVQLRPTELQFHLNLGEVYATAGLREKALDKLDSALERFGQDARLKQARGRIEKRRSPVLPILGARAFLESQTWQLRQPHNETLWRRTVIEPLGWLPHRAWPSSSSGLRSFYSPWVRFDCDGR